MTEHHRTSAWAMAARKARPIIKATLPAPCVNRCQLGGVVYPDQKWDVAHIVDVALGGSDALSNLGPAHIKCNRSDGGRAGARITNAKRKTTAVDRRLPAW